MLNALELHDRSASRSWRATSLSRPASATTALRLITRTLASLIASAEKAVLFPGLETEHIARQVEAADLPPPVIEDLVGPRGSAHDLVEVLGRFVLAVYLLVARERHGGAHQFDRAGQWMRSNGELDGSPASRAVGHVLNRRLHRHDPHPLLNLVRAVVRPMWRLENSDNPPKGCPGGRIAVRWRTPTP